MTADELLTTPLHDLHLELGAKMVAFAGYEMPVQYAAGIIQEHQHTRQHSGLFDVSHMGQVEVKGASAASDLERLLPIDLATLPINQQRYSLLTNDAGGVRDDLMVCRRSETDFLLVVNAACKEADLHYLQQQVGRETCVKLLADRALLALQGPESIDVLGSLAPELKALNFMQAAACDIAGIHCFVTRSGYTGEDGFEISLAATDALAFARRLLGFEQVQMIGLGARDSLRLEAGLCLYGHELSEQISPIEAGLDWVIAASRREGGAKAGSFPGDRQILQQIAGTVSRKRVGLRSQERAPIRAGTALTAPTGECVGTVTSGGYSPAAGAAIAMAYVANEFAKPGAELIAEVRGKQRSVQVVELPFVAHRYI
jgi:aminomethyltransferase